jgi:hypothetical protein
LNEDKAKYSCGVRPACPNTENITPLEPQGVKFSLALPEHSLHGKEPNSNEKTVPIPLLNEEKQNRLVESELPPGESDMGKSGILSPT